MIKAPVTYRSPHHAQAFNEKLAQKKKSLKAFLNEKEGEKNVKK